jgi:hypothetical protein
MILRGPDKEKREQTQMIVNKKHCQEKRRKSQTSKDKALATNYHSRQTSGKNQNREYFTVRFHNFFHCFLGNMVQRKLS